MTTVTVRTTQPRLLLFLQLHHLLLAIMTASLLQSMNLPSRSAASAFVPAFLTNKKSSLSIQHASSPLPQSLTAARKQQQKQHLVLVGGGHAHVQVITAMKARPQDRIRVTLIDAQKAASYSGMVPGCIAGLYNVQDTQLLLEPLAKWAELDEFIHDVVVDIDLERKQVMLLNRDEPVTFDVISLDIGSTSRGLDECRGAATFAIPTRPIDKLVQRLERARNEMTTADDDSKRKLVVIGGGAAGMELAMAVTSRWSQQGSVETTILDAGDTLLPGENEHARQVLRYVLHEKGIRVQHNCLVDAIDEEYVYLRNGKELPYTHCIWATGAGATRLARHLKTIRGLDCDEYGWIKVSPQLQSTSHPFLFAAGDCASIQGRSAPKAGVYAVRAGPILIENLINYVDTRSSCGNKSDNGDENCPEKRDLIAYEPQDDFLKLLVCGEDCAMGFRFGLTLQGKWVLDLKDNIDRSFMDRFDVSKLPEQVTEGNYDTSQYDATDDMKDINLPSPEQAAHLLQRTDDKVDFRQAKLVLRTMGRDASYREEVLEYVRDSESVCVAA
jgi:selenide, water dikinase